MNIVMLGDAGIGVKAVQEILNVLGAKPALVVDGIFGPLTAQAVADFQAKVRLPLASGAVDEQTWAVMQKEFSNVKFGDVPQPGVTPFAIIDGTIADGLFLFIIPVNGQNIQFVLDTGCALGIFFDDAIAKLLNLPKMGDEKVQGVGGQSTAYLSQVSFKLGNVNYKNVPCMVDEDPNFTMNLFGMVKFAEDNQIDFEVSTSKQQLILK